MNHVATQRFETFIQQLSEAEQLDLIAYVAAKLKIKQSARPPLDLAGYLSGKVQTDFDIDAALKEIRGVSRKISGSMLDQRRANQGKRSH